MSMIPYPLEFEHLVQVVRHAYCGYRAECVCGWAGAWTDEAVEADALKVDHYEVAVGPASNVDGVISGLLDLQDDLADTVMWLAEFWSSDLPAIEPRTRTDYSADPEGVPSLDLLVCCAADEFARLATLLGAAIVPDAAADSEGNRYERANRWFGRVRICAYLRMQMETSS